MKTLIIILIWTVIIISAISLVISLIDKTRYDSLVWLVKDYEQERGRTTKSVSSNAFPNVLEVTNENLFMRVWKRIVVIDFIGDLESGDRIIKIKITMVKKPSIKINKQFIPKDLKDKYYIYLVYDINNKPKIITITPSMIKDF